jgi:hypothetical protein
MDLLNTTLHSQLQYIDQVAPHRLQCVHMLAVPRMGGSRCVHAQMQMRTALAAGTEMYLSMPTGLSDRHMRTRTHTYRRTRRRMHTHTHSCMHCSQHQLCYGDSVQVSKQFKFTRLRISRPGNRNNFKLNKQPNQVFAVSILKKIATGRHAASEGCYRRSPAGVTVDLAASSLVHWHIHSRKFSAI